MIWIFHTRLTPGVCKYWKWTHVFAFSFSGSFSVCSDLSKVYCYFFKTTCPSWNSLHTRFKPSDLTGKNHSALFPWNWLQWQRWISIVWCNLETAFWNSPMKTWSMMIWCENCLFYVTVLRSVMNTVAQMFYLTQHFCDAWGKLWFTLKRQQKHIFQRLQKGKENNEKNQQIPDNSLDSWLLHKLLFKGRKVLRFNLKLWVLWLERQHVIKSRNIKVSHMLSFFNCCRDVEWSHWYSFMWSRWKHLRYEIEGISYKASVAVL